MRWWKVAFGIALLSLVPAVAEAHVVNGSGGWWDELICLVPTVVMLVLVVVLSRPTKNGDGEPKDPKK